MKHIPACEKLEIELARARAERRAAKFLSAEWKEAREREHEAKRTLKTCKKVQGRRGGIVYTKGLARAAHDLSVKFGLKPGFHEHAGLFQADNVIRAYFKVDSNDAIGPAAAAFAKKHDLDGAARQAAIIYTLKSAAKGAKTGFIAAQTGLALLDVVASVATVGGYAAAAPAVHAGLGAGQAVATKALQADIAKHEALYQGELERWRAKHRAAEAQIEAKQEEVDTATRIETAQQRQKEAKHALAQIQPWYTHKAVLVSGLALAASAAGYAFVRGRK